MDIEPLRTVAQLSDLTDRELRSFSQLLQFSVVKEGQRIVKEGGKIDAFYVIWAGVVHVRRMARKKEVLLGRMEQGGYFGEMNLFGPGIATASVYAMSEVQLASVPYERLRQFFVKYPAAGCRIMSRMLAETSARLFEANQRYLAAIFWSGVGEDTRTRK